MRFWFCSIRPEANTFALFVFKIGLLAVGLLPMMGIAAYLQNRAILGESDDGEVEGLASPGLILGSALNGIATVTAFNMQDDTASKYEKVR